MPLLADCSDQDINDVYQRDIARMEHIVMCKAGIAPFLTEAIGVDKPGFFYFEMYSNITWRPKKS